MKEVLIIVKGKNRHKFADELHLLIEGIELEKYQDSGDYASWSDLGKLTDYLPYFEKLRIKKTMEIK